MIVRLRTLVSLMAGSAVLGGAVVAGVALAGGANAAPAPGQFCSPRGGVYKTPSVTLMCSQSKSDSRYRWRNVLPERVIICDAKHPRTKVTLQSGSARFESYVCARRLSTAAGTTAPTTKTPTSRQPTTVTPTDTPSPTDTPTPTDTPSP